MGECECCKIIGGEGKGYQKVIVNMEGGWILNHFGVNNETYLGRLVLQTKRHCPDWGELCLKEATSLGMNIKRINDSLRQYWSKTYSKDPIELVHVAYLNETPYIKRLSGENLLASLHVHMHLLTRTQKIGRMLNYCGEQIGWHLVDDVRRFPSDYIGITEDDKRVVDLMNYLDKSLGM